jgi:hypothetical protein
MRRLVLLGLALVTFALPVFGQPKFGVTTKADKGTDFTKIKSYLWQPGFDASGKAHEEIVAAVDRELKTLGLEKKTSAPSVVIIKYSALRRTDVQVSTKATGADAARNTVEVGSLLIVMSQPGTSGKELWRARIDKPINVDPAKMAETIDGVVKDMFAHYPTRVAKK